MTNIMKTLMVIMYITGLSALVFAQEALPPRITADDAKRHVGETATVCGRVVDSKLPKYGLAGRGKPVWFDIDQPEPNPVFYLITFGTKDGGPQEAIDAYKGKNVCVTGLISRPSAGAPCIFVSDRSTIKVAPDAK